MRRDVFAIFFFFGQLFDTLLCSIVKRFIAAPRPIGTSLLDRHQYHLTRFWNQELSAKTTGCLRVTLTLSRSFVLSSRYSFWCAIGWTPSRNRCDSLSRSDVLWPWFGASDLPYVSREFTWAITRTNRYKKSQRYRHYYYYYNFFFFSTSKGTRGNVFGCLQRMRVVLVRARLRQSSLVSFDRELLDRGVAHVERYSRSTHEE